MQIRDFEERLKQQQSKISYETVLGPLVKSRKENRLVNSKIKIVYSNYHLK